MKPEYPPHPRCGLPVLRLELDEERDEWVRKVDICGEQLYLESHTSEWISDEGPCGPDDGPVWKLTCISGHVLMVPDDQGNEQFSEMPFLWDEAMKAVSHLLLIDGQADA
jgi:hypothetical protein